MYLDALADAIRNAIPEDVHPHEDSGALFRLYAVLARAKGAAVTRSDVHDAWSAWMAEREPKHSSLVQYGDLGEAAREETKILVRAIQDAAERSGHTEGSTPGFSDVLFPLGPPRGEEERQQVLDLYKIMVESSESLVSRRQGVNTFFLTMNGLILTAAGIIVQSSGDSRVDALGIAVLAIAGAILSGAWRSLITSFGQLNRGKFQVINTIERHLRASIYEAEWEALGRGEDPKVYRSFTSREIWVPTAFLVLYGLAGLVALLIAGGIIGLGTDAPAA